MDSEILVSVVIPTYNRGPKIRACLAAVCAQSYENFEMIVSDDNSSDDTVAIVTELMRSDSRIKLVRSSINTGVAGARNRGVKESKGDLVFFTDDDVLVPPDWISSGLRVFESNDCVGVEGQIIYVSETYRPRYSDRFVGNSSGGCYMTANMAYRRDVLLQAGLFNESFQRFEDRDLAFRVLKLGEIAFSPDFTVAHMLDRRTVRSYFKECRSAAAWVQFDIVNNQKAMMVWIFYRPDKLLTLLFPPIILGNLFSARFTSPYDYFLLLLLYPRLWYERFLVWQFAVRYRKLII
jgi:glycosyltransferase involved in cell wall biosynthesis